LKNNNYVFVFAYLDGSIEKLSVETKDERELYSCVLEGNAKSVLTLKSNNSITIVVVDNEIASSPQGISFYSL